MGTLTLRMLTMLALACCVLAACATQGPTQTYSYKLYPGPVRPPSEVAIVRLRDAGAVAFDGRPVSHDDWTEVHLAPGKPVIWWLVDGAGGVSFNPPKYGNWQPTLEAGHVYTLKASSTTPRYAYHQYSWMVDATTGRSSPATGPSRSGWSG